MCSAAVATATSEVWWTSLVGSSDCHSLCSAAVATATSEVWWTSLVGSSDFHSLCAQLL